MRLASLLASRSHVAPRPLIAVVVAAALVLTAVAPVFAATPTIEPIYDHEVFMAPALSAECGFAVLRDVTVKGTLITYADGSQELTMTQVSYWSANGNTIIERDAFGIHTDAAGTSALSGADYMAYEEGTGLVVVDAGRLVFDTNGDIELDTGPHPVVAEGRGVFFCPVLAA